MKVRLFIMLCSLLSFSVCAEEFEYDYIQFGIATTDSKYTDKQYFVDLSKSVNDNISIKGLIAYTYGDWNDPGEYEELRGNYYAIEGVYHDKVTVNTDIVISVEFAHADYRFSCTPTTGVCGVRTDDTPSFNYYLAKVGFRHKLRNDIEVESKYKTIGIEGSSVTARQFKIGLMKDISSRISIGTDYTWGLNNGAADSYGVFVRRSF